MNQDEFRVLVVDLSRGRGRVDIVPGRTSALGGSGLAALLFQKIGDALSPWNDPEQPFILAVGSLTGLFPRMSKTVCSFKSPYHDQYPETHGGGRRCRWQLRFATGFRSEDVTLPKRFYKVSTWKGTVDGLSLDTLKEKYGHRISELEFGGNTYYAA